MDNEISNPVNEAEEADTTIASQLFEEQPEVAEEPSAENNEGEEATLGDEDFERMASEDLEEIKRLFPSFSGISHIREIDSASRFGEMREAGFSVEEAFMATNYEKVFDAIIKRARMTNSKSHLTSAIPAQSGAEASSMTVDQMRAAKELFSTLSEKEIHSLYKRATS